MACAILGPEVVILALRPGNTGPRPVWREDYSADHPGNYLFYVRGAAEPGQLGLSEGSCVTDIDCADDLICHFCSNGGQCQPVMATGGEAPIIASLTRPMFLPNLPRLSQRTFLRNLLLLQ